MSYAHDMSYAHAMSYAHTISYANNMINDHVRTGYFIQFNVIITLSPTCCQKDKEKMKTLACSQEESFT